MALVIALLYIAGALCWIFVALGHAAKVSLAWAGAVFVLLAFSLPAIAHGFGH